MNPFWLIFFRWVETTNQINRERDFCRLPTKFPSAHLRWGKLLTFLFGCAFFFLGDIFQPAIWYFTGWVDNTNVTLWLPDSPSSLQGKLSEAVDWFHMALSMSVRRGPQNLRGHDNRWRKNPMGFFLSSFCFFFKFPIWSFFLAAQQNPLMFFFVCGFFWKERRLHPRGLTVRPWKMMVGRRSGFLLGPGNFSRAKMLNFRGVNEIAWWAYFQGRFGVSFREGLTFMASTTSWAGAKLSSHQNPLLFAIYI